MPLDAQSLFPHFDLTGADRTPRKWQGSKWIRREKRKAIYARDGHRCACCDAETNLSLDHITPHRHGGTNHEGNLITACARCNKSRQDKPLEEFLKKVAPRDWKRRMKKVIALAGMDLKQFRTGAMVAPIRKTTKPNKE